MRISSFLFVLLCSVIASAQIVTDRPSNTENANVVPVKAFQIETGFVLEQDQFQNGLMNVRRTNISINNGVMRFGLARSTELRLNWSLDMENYCSEWSGLTCATGVEDTLLYKNSFGMSTPFLGMKQNLFKRDNVSVGLVVQAPMGGPFAPQVYLPLSFDLTDRFNISAQIGGIWDQLSDPAQLKYSLCFGYGFNNGFWAYIEPYGYLINEVADLRMNGGVTYTFKDNMMVDLIGGFGVSSSAPDFFVGCGYSYLFLKP